MVVSMSEKEFSRHGWRRQPGVETPRQDEQQ